MTNYRFQIGHPDNAPLPGVPYPALWVCDTYAGRPITGLNIGDRLIPLDLVLPGNLATAEYIATGPSTWAPPWFPAGAFTFGVNVGPDLMAHPSWFNSIASAATGTRINALPDVAGTFLMMDESVGAGAVPDVGELPYGGANGGYVGLAPGAAGTALFSNGTIPGYRAIAEADIANGTILARLAAAETVTGEWVFDGVSGVRAHFGTLYNGGVAYNAGDQIVRLFAWTGHPRLQFGENNVGGYQISIDGQNLLISAAYDGAGGEKFRLDSNGNLGLRTSSFGASSVGVVGLANATTVPTGNPTGGGVYYAQGGVLKYRSSAGAITALVGTGNTAVVGAGGTSPASGEMGHVILDTQSGAISTTGLTNGTPAGEYLVEYFIGRTQNDSGLDPCSFNFEIGYTDPTGATTQVSANIDLSVAGSRARGVFPVSLASGNITWKTNKAAGTVTNGLYALRARCIHLV